MNFVQKGCMNEFSYTFRYTNILVCEGVECTIFLTLI